MAGKPGKLLSYVNLEELLLFETLADVSEVAFAALTLLASEDGGLEGLLGRAIVRRQSE